MGTDLKRQDCFHVAFSARFHVISFTHGDVRGIAGECATRQFTGHDAEKCAVELHQGTCPSTNTPLDSTKDHGTIVTRESINDLSHPASVPASISVYATSALAWLGDAVHL